MPRLRLFAILCFDSQERREAPRLVYRLDTRGAGLYRRQPVTVPPVPCHLRFTRQRHPPRQVTLPPPYPFSRPAAQRVIEVPALHLWFAVLYPRVEHQAVLAVVVVVVGPLVVHPYHPFRDAVRLLRQPAVFIVAVQPLETGMQMMRVADSRWPESLQQQQASTQWNEALKTRAQSSPQLRGWLQTRQDLHAFADPVMQREKEGLTLSYIKNVIWQAERGLGQETPVESLLTQYQDARAQKQNTDALEKQINERLEGVLSRWLLLKNNVMPEAATGTTAEK